MCIDWICGLFGVIFEMRLCSVWLRLRLFRLMMRWLGFCSSCWLFCSGWLDLIVMCV